MATTMLSSVAQLPNHELLAQVKVLAERERAAPEQAGGRGAGRPAPPAAPGPLLAPSAAALTPPARPAVVAPLAPERYKVQFTASADTYAKLRLAQDLLRHQIPDGDVGKVLDRALTALVQELTRKKLAATDRPRGAIT